MYTMTHNVIAMTRESVLSTKYATAPELSSLHMGATYMYVAHARVYNIFP